MRDAQTLLLHALRQRTDPAPELRVARSEAWASATFVGARHRFVFAPLDADRAAALAERLEEAEFDLPRHLVADIAVTARTVCAAGTTLTIEALTVEDR